MCGRYANHVTAMLAWEGVIGEWPPETPPLSFNIAPTQTVPVFLHRSTIGMRWGLVPHWSKEIGKFATFNARIESIATKPAFRNAWSRSQRCLIPARGYYEWKLESGKKQPYFIHPPDEGPLMFGGLWEKWRSEQAELLSCTIITQPAAGSIRPIHDRMPLMLAPSQGEVWLRGSVDEVASALKINRPPELEFHRVGTRVNNPRNGGAELVLPMVG